MGYFKGFPVINYTINDQTVAMQDITRRAKFVQTLPKEAFLRYFVKDLDTPDGLAWRFYKNEQLYWIILLANDMFDVVRDWPKSDIQLREELIAEFGAEGMYFTHHWEDNRGYVINEDDPEVAVKIPISNLEHYTRINESRKVLRIPRAELVKEIVQQHQRIIGL